MGEPLFRHRLDTLDGLDIRARTAQVAKEGSESVLELDGAVLVPDLEIEDVGIEVEILAPAPCYPGIAFRFSDLEAFELAYAVPAVSGQADAIQYDPIFTGSNTWQLYTGRPYQKQATVPTGEWFRFRADVVGKRAAFQIGDQPPLVVEDLARETGAGRLGLWTYRPARFRNLRVTAAHPFAGLSGETPQAPAAAIDAWWLEGTGRVGAEPNGVLNLNRYRAAAEGEARLVRRFATDRETDVEIGFGFSDELELSLDGASLFKGMHTFCGFETEAARGWVRPGNKRIISHTGADRHRLEAVLRITEPFGWGLIVTLGGEGVHLRPVGGGNGQD